MPHLDSLGLLTLTASLLFGFIFPFPPLPLLSGTPSFLLFPERWALPTWEPFTLSSSAWSTVCLRLPHFSSLPIPLSCFTSLWHSLPSEFSISGALPICPTGTKAGLQKQGHHLVWTHPCQSDIAEEVPSQGMVDKQIRKLG